MELDIEKIKAETSSHLSRNKMILGSLFLSGLLGFLLIFSLAPSLSQKDQRFLYRLPTNPETLSQMAKTINKYTSVNYFYVLFSISYIYILLQAFSIPGPPFLNILVGALFDFYTGFALVTVCSTVGSILCYILYETIGKGIAIRMFPSSIVSIHKKIYNNRENVFFYLLSMRVTPFVPKWLTAISSPIIGVPLKTFALTSFLGLMPHNFIHINTGIAIASMKDFGLTLNNFLCLLGLGILSLIPTFIFKKVKKS